MEEYKTLAACNIWGIVPIVSIKCWCKCTCNSRVGWGIVPIKVQFLQGIVPIAELICVIMLLRGIVPIATTMYCTWLTQNALPLSLSIKVFHNSLTHSRPHLVIQVKHIFLFIHNSPFIPSVSLHRPRRPILQDFSWCPSSPYLETGRAWHAILPIEVTYPSVNWGNFYQPIIVVRRLFPIVREPTNLRGFISGATQNSFFPPEVWYLFCASILILNPSTASIKEC